MLLKLKAIFEVIKKNITIISVVAVMILLFLFLNQCNTTRRLKNEIKTEAQKTAQNLAALTDSIKIYKNRAGQDSYSKPIAEMSPDEIKKYFPDLYQRMKNELGEVKVIWRTRIEYRDTGSVKNGIVQLDTNKFSLNYNYYSKDSSLNIKSTNTFFADAKLVDKEKNKYSVVVSPGISTINNISLKLGFTTGIKKEGTLYKIFITPDSKNIYITSLEGADVSNMINPPQSTTKKKRFGISIVANYGVIVGNNGKVGLGAGFGIGVSYSLIRF